MSDPRSTALIQADHLKQLSEQFDAEGIEINDSAENKAQNNDYHPVQWVAEASYPLLNGFISPALLLIAASLMSIDTDDKERDEVTYYILLATIVMNLYGYIVQSLRQYAPQLLGAKIESFEEVFWSMTNAAAAYIFGLSLVESVYIDSMTSGDGTDEEVIVSPATFALLNIAPIALGLFQVISECCPEDYALIKKFKKVLLDSVQEISSVESTITSIEGIFNVSRTGSLNEMLPRYLISILVGLGVNYYTHQMRQNNVNGEEKETPVYVSSSLYLKSLFSAFNLSMYQFEKSLQLFGPVEKGVLVSLTTAQGVSVLGARAFFGPPKEKKDELQIEEVSDENSDDEKEVSLREVIVKSTH